MTTLPKPAHGAASLERRQRRARIETQERNAKSAAKQRDRYTCRRCGLSIFHAGITMESAHIRGKGMGGDSGRFSGEARHYVTLCAGCHRGPYSCHSGHVKIAAGPRGGDAEVYFCDVVPGGKPVERNCV